MHRVSIFSVGVAYAYSGSRNEHFKKIVKTCSRKRILRYSITRSVTRSQFFVSRVNFSNSIWLRAVIFVVRAILQANYIASKMGKYPRMLWSSSVDARTTRQDPRESWMRDSREWLLTSTLVEKLRNFTVAAGAKFVRLAFLGNRNRDGGGTRRKKKRRAGESGEINGVGVRNAR